MNIIPTDTLEAIKRAAEATIPVWDRGAATYLMNPHTVLALVTELLDRRRQEARDGDPHV